MGLPGEGGFRVATELTTWVVVVMMGVKREKKGGEGGGEGGTDAEVERAMPYLDRVTLRYTTGTVARGAGGVATGINEKLCNVMGAEGEGEGEGEGEAGRGPGGGRGGRGGRTRRGT